MKAIVRTLQLLCEACLARDRIKRLFRAVFDTFSADLFEKFVARGRSQHVVSDIVP